MPKRWKDWDEVPEDLCGRCNAEHDGCMIKFIDEMSKVCICQDCIIKTMCQIMCEEREAFYDDLPDSVKNIIDKVEHEYKFGNKEVFEDYRKQMYDMLNEAGTLEGFL